MLCAGPLFGAQTCHHEITAKLEPEAGRLIVSDTIRIDRLEKPEITSPAGREGEYHIRFRRWGACTSIPSIQAY